MSVLRAILAPRSRRDASLGTWANPSALLRDLLGAGKTSAGQRVTPTTAEGIPVVYACVGILADTLAQLPLKVYRATAQGQEEAYEHPLYDVLHDLPNPFTTSVEFREVLMRWLCLWGDAYAEIERDRNGRVVGLWPLSSDRMTVDRAAGGRPQYVYRLLSGGVETWTIDNPDNPPIFHLRINSLDGLTGRSPVTVLRESLGLGLAQDQHAATFFGNSALPDLILSKKGPGTMGKQARQNFIESWKDRFGGSAKAHGVALLEEEFTVTPITMPAKDAQFLEARNFQVEELARIYRVPLHLIQHTTANTSWGTGIESQARGFVNFTLMPWLVRWEQAIARDLLSRKSFRTHQARFAVQGLLRGDSQARSEYYAKLHAVGALSTNDIRALEEMNSIGSDGDRRFVSTNLQPLDPDDVPMPELSAPAAAGLELDEGAEASEDEGE